MFEKWKWKQLEKKIQKLSPEKKAKLKEIMTGYQEGRNCIHGVSYENLVCFDCMERGSLSDIVPFLTTVKL